MHRNDEAPGGVIVTMANSEFIVFVLLYMHVMSLMLCGAHGFFFWNKVSVYPIVLIGNGQLSVFVDNRFKKRRFCIRKVSRCDITPGQLLCVGQGSSCLLF